MKQAALWLCVCLAVCLLSGCTVYSPLENPVRCEDILSLRIGQSMDEVRKILGEPTSVNPGTAVPFDGNGEMLEGVDWYYGPAPSVLPPAVRDQFDVSFYEGRLTWISAYRMAADRDIDAYWLLKDPRKPEQPEQRKKGPAFDMFSCANR